MSGTGIDQQLKDKPYFHGLIARDDVADLLRRKEEFLLRVTEPKRGMHQSVVISVLHDPTVDPKEGVRHYIIRSDAKGFHCEKFCCKTIPELVEKYVRERKGLDSRDTVKIKYECPRQEWELHNKDVHLEKKLGEGAYGEVWMGDYVAAAAKKKGSSAKEKTRVAIKQNHMENLNKDQINEVMGEARIMRKNAHHNIVRLVGIASLEQPLLIVMELADLGSLDGYLKKNGSGLAAARKAEMCADVAFALRFLRHQNILHRDLAARNCLLFNNNTVKISDFGKSQPGPTYAMEPKEKLPIRWLAPETMRTKKFTFASEVWSFGIVCWEIFSNGAEPYPGMLVKDVNDAVREGLRLDMPPDTPYDIRVLVELGCFTDEAGRNDIETLAVRLSTITGRSDSPPPPPPPPSTSAATSTRSDHGTESRHNGSTTRRHSTRDHSPKSKHGSHADSVKTQGIKSKKTSASHHTNSDKSQPTSTKEKHHKKSGHKEKKKNSDKKKEKKDKSRRGKK